MPMIRSATIFLILFQTVIGLSQEQTVGLFLNDVESYNGYTLFSNNKSTYLIDNCGFIINQWMSDYKPGSSVYLLENGNLLRTARKTGSFTGGGLGGRFELFDWEGNLIWSYNLATANQHSHHDIEPLPNGNFLAIVWERMSNSEANLYGRKYSGEVWSEKVIEINISGNAGATIVWEWKLKDHLIQDHDATKLNYGTISDHPELIDFNFIGIDFPTSGDWIHLNSIDYNPELDQIILSSRNFSEVWIIDHSTTTEEAAGHSGGNANSGGDIIYRYGNPRTYGRGDLEDQIFFEQHDANWVQSGGNYLDEISVFNNHYSVINSSVEKWSLPINGFGYELMNNEPFGPDELDWTFTADKLYSDIMSSAHLLPNNNLLICEGKSGHFIEYTMDGTLVWDYINPVNTNGFPVLQGGTPQFNSTFKIIRYPSDYHAFAGISLDPGLPVELAPWESNCQIHLNTSVDEVTLPLTQLIQNPIHDVLRIDHSGHSTRAQIINLLGASVLELEVSLGASNYDISSFSPGLYFLRIPNSSGIKTLPFIKL